MAPIPALDQLARQAQHDLALSLRETPEVLPPVDLPPHTPDVQLTPETNTVWPLGLREAIRIALENSEVIRMQEGGAVFASPSTAFDPAIAESRRHTALAAFDMSLNASYIGSQYNQPTGTFFGPGINATARRDDGTFSSALIKPWPTGAETRLSYNPYTGYLYFPNYTGSSLNPLHSSNLEFSIRQPLLRGAGTDVNYTPIRVAQLRADQSVWDVKQSTLALVRSVEENYWGLQASHASLKALDQILKLVDDVVRVQEERYHNERTILAEVAKVKVQQAEFRQQRIEARSAAIDKELKLRNLLGLDPADRRTIVPVDLPTRAPLHVDPQLVIQTALSNRPDLMRQRMGVRIREIEVFAAQNAMLPQLDVQALYRTNGLSDNLSDSLSMMSRHQFTDWTLGATFSIPLGNRAATSNWRAAQLQLQKELALLRQGLHASAHRISDLLRQLEAIQQSCELAEVRVRQSSEWLRGARIRYEDPPPGGEGQDWLLLALNDYLFALRSTIDAETESVQLLSQYNSLLARLEEAKGTLLEVHTIDIDNDPTDRCRYAARRLDRIELLEPIRWRTAP